MDDKKVRDVISEIVTRSISECDSTVNPFTNIN